MEDGGHVGTQGNMYRLRDRGEARLECQSSVSLLSRYGRQPEKRAFTKPYLCEFCQLTPTNDFVVFCWRQEVEKQRAQSDKNKKTLRRLLTTKGKMRRCRVWLPCSMGAAGTRAWSPWQNHRLVSNVTTSWTPSQWPTTFTRGKARRGPSTARAKARWTSWFKFGMSEEDDTGHVLERHKIEEQIAEERVQCPFCGPRH